MCVANCFDIVQDHFYMTLQLLRKPQPQEVVPKMDTENEKGATKSKMHLLLYTLKLHRKNNVGH